MRNFRSAFIGLLLLTLLTGPFVLSRKAAENRREPVARDDGASAAVAESAAGGDPAASTSDPALVSPRAEPSGALPLQTNTSSASAAEAGPDQGKVSQEALRQIRAL